MEEGIIKSAKNICNFCQTHIKNESESINCPSCNSPYHKDCWLENKGCAVYGCDEKIDDHYNGSSIREVIINIEYLINRNQYSEAIYEAKQYLKIDRRNSELKNLYNKAVSLINNKINLMSSADEAFGKRDYKAAEIYYKNVLKYADDVETNFVNTRLEIAKEKIPEQKRRRVYQNILIIVIILAILTAIGYLGYYTFVLQEDRDYAELIRSDNATDLRTTEQMIGKYEAFLKNYPNGKNKIRALNRIHQYSYQIASIHYKDNWKLALKYYNKIFNTLEAKEAQSLQNNIFNVAFEEYRQKISNAKKLNSTSKYSEALNELNNAMLIISSFPESDITKEKNILESNMTLLNKKISSIIKSNDLEREIRDQNKELGLNKSSGSGTNATLIAAKLEKLIEPNIFLATELGTDKTIAIKSHSENNKVGQLVNLECIKKGNVSLPDDENGIVVPLYIPYYETDEFGGKNLSIYEKEAIHERLKNLKIQKAKIDSLLKQNLL